MEKDGSSRPADTVPLQGQRPSFGEATEHCQRNFWLGVTNGVIFNASSAFLNANTILPLFVSRLTESRFLVGTASALHEVGWFVPQLFVAAATAHRERQKPFYIRAAFFRLAVFTALLASFFFSSYQKPEQVLFFFFLFYGLYSIGGGFAGVAFMEIVSKTVPPERRGSFWGLRMSVGGLLAAAFGRLVAEILDNNPFPRNYEILFLFAFFFIFAGLFSFVWVKEPVLPNLLPKVPYRQRLQEAFSLLKTDPHFFRLYCTRLLIGTYTVAAPFYVLFGRFELGFPVGFAGLFVSAEVLGLAVSNLWWSAFSNRGKDGLVLVGSAGLAVFAPVWALASGWFGFGPYLFALIFFALGATNSGLAVGYLNHLLKIAPESSRTLYIGLLHTLLFPILFFPGLGGVILQNLSYLALFSFAFAVALAGAFLAWRIFQLQRKVSAKT
ncbi:MAG TPA: MFS transporter [Verrucomicrobiae bacterium]|nr:MFS transporter [Verrucomicrobiae bacterium]